MGVPTFFEVEWTGPYLTADKSSGKETSRDKEVKSESLQPLRVFDH